MALRGLVGTGILLALLGLLPFLGWINWYVLLIGVLALGQVKALPDADRRGVWPRILWVLIAVAAVRLLLGGGFF